MATKDDGVRLCAECAKEPPIDGLPPFHGMCARCGEVLPDEAAPEGAADDIERMAEIQEIVQAWFGDPDTTDTGRAVALSKIGRALAKRSVKRAPVESGAEDDIERARRGPVPVVAPGMTPEQAAVIREAETFVDSVKPGALPSIAGLCQAVATMRGAVAPILARYAREIEHARSRGHVVTAARIEHERDEYQEAGQ